MSLSSLNNFHDGVPHRQTNIQQQVARQVIKIPFRELSVSDPDKKKRLLAAVNNVLNHGKFILGPEVEHFESELASYCGKTYAIGVSSGTDALYMALRALGVGPGDEVITTPLSWIATLNSIVMTGATPVFVDIDRHLHIDSDLVEKAITGCTKAIIPVHFTGQLCDITKIVDIANRYEIAVIEDAAQAFGARLGDKPAGAFGSMACFSMNPMKVFCSYGEAGAVLCDDQRLRDKLQSLRYGGTVNKEDCHYPSLNFRIDTLQAAMMLVEMNYVDEIIRKRRKVAAFYHENLSAIVECPEEKPGFFHTYYSYTIKTDERDALMHYLQQQGIETKIQHKILMPHHTAYRSKWSGANIPNAEHTIGQILCLPCDDKVTEEQLAYTVDRIKAFYK